MGTDGYGCLGRVLETERASNTERTLPNLTHLGGGAGRLGVQVVTDDKAYDISPADDTHKLLVRHNRDLLDFLIA
ncbi:hypothetical protein CEB3_c42710 [Peptococcaceae bacterium CEB3]|nr:hypothetical protein CEB3_c42710 [Peptococcaceae bacterium CEB3]